MKLEMRDYFLAYLDEYAPCQESVICLGGCSVAAGQSWNFEQQPFAKAKVQGLCSAARQTTP